MAQAMAQAMPIAAAVFEGGFAQKLVRLGLASRAVGFGFSPWTSIGGSAAHIVASLLSLRGRAARLCIALAGGIIAMPFANDVIGEVSAFLGVAVTRPCAASDLGGTA